MPGNKYNLSSSHIPLSRTERLLRERELRDKRRSNRALNPNDNPDNSENDLRLEGDSSRQQYVEQYLEGAAAAMAHDDVCERQEVRPYNRQRLLVVANRLPVSAVRRGEDSWSLEISAGGLVSALLGVKEFEARWIGWAGVNVPDEVGQKALTKALAEKRCIPVFLDEEIVHQYYNGYCNNILWPLFHYLGLPQEDRLATTRSFQSQFTAYKKANQMFADVVNEHYEEGDVVWCHDYHLMFLPKCLKEYNSKMKVGWFLHTPFPSSEIHRTLPSRSELLRSVLAADLVGFHTYDYARHFVSACTRILGLEGTPEGVEDQGRLTRVAAFPIGIDSERFIRALEVPDVIQHMKELKERFAGRKVMLGVDRLDMIKGIPQKILAFEKFLEENASWRDKVVLLQIAVPTRTDVSEYQKLTSQVHEIVGRINGRFGTLTQVPIHHLDRSLDFYALCALYAVTDVALVTSLRDGMNLVSYEFVACQEAKKGVLILSEFAGAAQSLGAGAILVNPWNITEVAASIGQALNMSPEEREKRHRHNFHHVKTHTAQEWAETFVSELNDTVIEAQLRISKVPPELPQDDAIRRYSKSTNRLLILGFNATLTEPVDNQGRRGDQIKEMDLNLHPELKGPLKALCSDPSTTIVVLSGSSRSVLDKNFGEYDMWLAAENGMFLRLTNGEWMTTMPEHLNMEWVDSVKHVFKYFTERTPRSHFETRDTSLIWNYKYADIEFGRLQARDLLQHLWTGPISNASVDVVQGSRSVEVRAVGVTKGAAIDRILGEIVHSKSMTTPIDYVLCIGHFLGKDEDVYTFFEPELPSDIIPAIARSRPSSDSGGTRSSSVGGDRRPPSKSTHHNNNNNSKSSSKSSSSNSNHHNNKASSQRSLQTTKSGSNNHSLGNSRRPSPEKISWNVLDLKGENYFSCAVGRTRTSARYLLGSPDDVVCFLEKLADAPAPNSS
ncbi:alpha,alpha-trehalose-phosphate synthase [UDP-forming] 1 [Brassica napus]|uniref:alpha,alpha-trehalose-phosphate synthase (UDP-forming) n=2 Tax=Brassica TaxID=3705 RepID=A0A816QTV9_BRANA|nr:PREDICTED: alpha,alpha-trehalose-phosphate synthase [UDP-forming] 1 [Brassica oleracea var. oleracea]XP_013591482.1 PREDICTED: alpha,alpha-trehalose-phosphate synthase [UDP-forming] 1 [Brassica oleracea var. oleracea]XP_013591483.1 PREDICTED: alpha,alpha-trehalose-phosphate synthase [UDP-forming] 1 [Brassica oleracea var. oleracea]XP_013591484.1 PREDICTED: alpha,alpha-trehalose-phosphate synthase [UDP-forming] 1 [Brassica oleracea var. oleracea]XP_013591485.1 PREDICTED: alpha,alpha-trehalose